MKIARLFPLLKKLHKLQRSVTKSAQDWAESKLLLLRAPKRVGLETFRIDLQDWDWM